MYALNDHTTPSHDNTTAVRPGFRGPFAPWGYRHLRTVANVRFAVGTFLTVLAAVLLAHGDYGWAMVPLAGAAVHFSLGYWQLTLARSAAHRLGR
jgi:hypothetical protein